MTNSQPEATDQQIVDTAVRHLRAEKDEAERWAARYLARAERAESELARVCPVADAAEALVEHRATATTTTMSLPAYSEWEVRHYELLETLFAAVKEAQR